MSATSSPQAKAGHSGEHGHGKAGLAALVAGAVGVVFGDIGTSPLYTIKEMFHPHFGLKPDPDTVLGLLSLGFWSLITERSHHRVVTWLISLLGIFAAALFYGDSMITPAISVLSAVEGLEIITPDLKPYVLPLTVGILSGLFFIQRRGTGTVGLFFGPVMIGWFGVLGLLGVLEIARHPR